jgi:hypothetical protein
MTFTKQIILAVATLALLVPAGPAVADEIYFSPADTMILTFDPFPVHVMVDDIGSIMGYNISMTLSGDPCVQIVNVIEGPLPSSQGDPTFFRWLDPGDPVSITVNGSVLGTTVDGPGILFTIYLQALMPGVAWLDLASSDLRNGVNESLPHGSDGRARIVVDEVIGVDGSSWGAVKSLYRDR